MVNTRHTIFEGSVEPLHTTSSPTPRISQNPEDRDQLSPSIKEQLQ
jgi:hypothetical protein